MSGNLLTNYITIAADVLNHVFKGNTVTDRNSTRRANCAKQDTEGPPGGGGVTWVKVCWVCATGLSSCERFVELFKETG